MSQPEVAIIGAGPGGLMAAEIISSAGFPVTVYELKPTPARKFLLAGRGGLNLTHSEDMASFITRYGAASKRLQPALKNFPPSALRAWCAGLGEATFVGSSGRVFPESFKASPLLRAWRARLDTLGVKFIFQRQWMGWDEAGRLVFSGPDGTTQTVRATATVLALGGASWPRLGADGSWADILRAQNIPVTPLAPANCGFFVTWSEVFRSKFAGRPLKPVRLSFSGTTFPGEMMITEKGVEGGIVYAFSAAIRDQINRTGPVTVSVDLCPGISCKELTQRLSVQRAALSFSNVMKKIGLSPVASALVRETGGKNVQALSAEALAAHIKNVPLVMEAPFPLDRAISSSGGIALDGLDDYFMLKRKPGVFAVGEMLDWEAPTGGYLLQATFSTAALAAEGVLLWCRNSPKNF